MADSKFLRFQDLNGDGSIDVCDDLGVQEVEKCPSCIPNPNAITPKWKNRSIDEPWFNDKYCTYQVTVETTEMSLLPYGADPETITTEEANEHLKYLFDKYVEDAVEALLDGFNKDDRDKSKKIARDAIEYTKYDLEIRNFARVKLLYTIPFDPFDSIEERDTDNDEEEADEPGEKIVFTYDASNINPKLLKLRKGMYMYARYFRVFQALENGSFVFEDSGKVFTKSQFDRYGDLGFFLGDSRMKAVLTDLDNWLNDRGMNIFGVGGGWGWFRDTVKKIEFTLTPERKLIKLRLWTAKCRKRPKTYRKRRLKGLNRKSSWKDPTAVNYFSRLHEIDNFLSARVERPWIEFVEEFTYPKVVSTYEYPQPETEDARTVGSCIADALAEEGKQLGMDILDDIFSLGDAIAYTFHKNVCQQSLKDVDDERNAIGLAYKPNGNVDFGKVVDKSSGETKNIFGMATEQAYAQMYQDDRLFVQMCARMIGAALPFPGGGEQMIHDMWKFGFSRMKFCGLLDLMLEAIQCLFKGLSLEEALSVAIKAALNAMSIENFGDLFVGLPEEKKAELDELVKKKLENDDIFGRGSNLQRMSDEGQATGSAGGETLQDKPFFGKIQFKVIPKPWEDEDIIEAERANLKESNDGTYPRPKDPYKSGAPQKTERTLAQQFDFKAQADRELDPNNVMQAYIAALIEVHADNLLGLTDLLNRYPGAQIIAQIIALFDCPRPPMFDPSFFDFLKSIDLPFCRNMNEIKMFRMENPSNFLPYLYDIPRLIWEAVLLVLQMLLIQIIMKILVKICEIIGNAICKALETVGDIALAIPAVIAGRTTFADVIRDSICGPGADEEQVDTTIAEMFEKLGVGGAALADTAAVKRFAGDISSATTREEMTSAFLGDAGNDFINITYSIMENQYPEFLEGLPTKDHLRDFFADVGNLFPVDVKAALRQMLDALPANDTMPANPSICSSPEDLENFKDRRCMLLEGRATPEQCQTMFDDIKNETLEDLEELTSALQGGIPAMIEDALPPFFSQPGCDDGLVPFESDENIAVSMFAQKADTAQLEIDFATDMLGDGDFGSGEKGWGFLNMVLTDTHGEPFTTHNSRVANKVNSVDFVRDTESLYKQTNTKLKDVVLLPEFIADAITPAFVPSVSEQKNQYPAFVAEWMWTQMNNANIQFLSNNSYGKDRIFTKSFEDLGWTGWFWNNVNLLELPQFGWNTKLNPNYSSETLIVKSKARKEVPDILLNYEDNNSGYSEHMGLPWNWGYDVALYLPETIKKKVTAMTPEKQQEIDELRAKINFQITERATSDSVFGNNTELLEAALESLQRIEDEIEAASRTVIAYRPDDNARILVLEKTLVGGGTLPANYNSLTDDQKKKADDDSRKSGTVYATRAYEFYTVDHTLDDFDLSGYINYQTTQTIGGSTIPQMALLSDFVGSRVNKSIFDSTMTNIFTAIRDEITGPPMDISVTNLQSAPSKTGWLYGAAYDDLQLEDIEYVVDNGQTLYPGGSPYGQAQLPDYDEEGKRDGSRNIKNNDMILGISKMQFDEENRDSGRKNRVFYLDPGTYGGTYTRPKVYIKPLENKGWRGIVDVIYPELSPCKPSKRNVVDFDDINDQVSRTYQFLPDDKRLQESEYCANEKPYNRILERYSKAGIQGAIQSACRIYATTHMLKALPTFLTFGPEFPGNYSSLYASYIIEIMEEGFKNSQPAFWEWFSAFKDEEFWYAFLEQSVQTYGRLVDDGTVSDPPEPVLAALRRLNDAQENYDYEYKKELRRARSSGRAEPWPWDTLATHRDEEKFNAIRATEDDAKLVLKEMIIAELNAVGATFTHNLTSADMEPDYFDLGYYFMSKLCNGAKDITIKKNMKEEVIDLPTEGEGLYTNGDQFADKAGVPYVGFYHVHKDEDGNTIYMEGETHTPDTDTESESDVVQEEAYGTGAPGHGEIVPFANKVSIPFGDIADYGTAAVDGKSFTLEKYISINGVKYSPLTAVGIINQADPELNISDVYPGTLEYVYFKPRDEKLYDSRSDVLVKEPALPLGQVEPPGTRVVGLKGELGVRMGLQLSLEGAGEIVSVEVDALDVKIPQMPTLEGNSKLLYCLVKKMREHEKFRLLTEYIFPLNKATATWAIYNDFGFLDAIGQKTVDFDAHLSNSMSDKPGTKVYLDEDGKLQGYRYTPGWEAKPSRANPAGWPMSWFVNDNPWDDWDKQLLRNSNSRIKAIFKKHYNRRDFGPANGLGDDFNPGKIILRNLKSAFALPPLSGQLPWWTKRRLAPNPFDANGNICKKR